MSIVETGAKAMRSVVWAGDDWDAIGDTARDLYRNEFRAALRAIKPEDVSDGMLEAFKGELRKFVSFQYVSDETVKHSLAAMLNAAGAEQ